VKTQKTSARTAQLNRSKENKMKNNKIHVFLTALMLISLTVSACAPSAQSNPADRFAGTWSGIMSATDDPSAKSDTVTTIPTGCSLDQICGDTINLANGCRWEMTLIAVNGDVLEYAYSKSLEGDCPVSGSGTLTLNPDGTLFRVHNFPDFSISGTLTRK
jgi:hypothetical protein